MDESIDEPSFCHMCNRPANPMYIGASKWSVGKEFCSRNCQDAYLGKLVAYVGGAMLGLSFFFIITVQSEAAILFSLIGGGILVVGLFMMSLKANPVKLKTEKILTNLELNGDPQDQIIYSNILLTTVYPCCHQSARLNDQYCACGRVIEYPLSND